MKSELDESQAGIKIAGRNINNHRYADDTPLMAESEEEIKSLLMRVNEENEKGDLKLNKSHHFMANGRGKVKAMTDFIFLGSKIFVDGDCSQEIKRHLFLGRKVMTSLDNISKSRDITADKICIVKGMVFPVVTYRCENWSIKKAEH